MAKKSTLKTIKGKVLSFVSLLKQKGVPITSVFLFGSQVKGKPHAGSDIDVCLVSPSFSNRFEDRLNLMRFRRQIDTMIEPHPFSLKEFVDENPLVWEIKKTGEKLL